MTTTYTNIITKAQGTASTPFFTKTGFFNKIALFIAIFALSASAVFSAIPSTAEAATPTLAFASSGVNLVLVSVYGDPNQAVNLYYYNVGTTLINSVGSIGTTNSSGYFSNTISGTAYNIPSGASVYVVVNGQQSTTTLWPSVAGGNVYLSQTSITMNQGQSTTVSVSGGNGSGYYVNSNSNSGVVGATISGNIITLNAIGTGYASINICSIGSSTTTCAPLAVTVNSVYGGNSGSIYLSPSSVTVAPGQSQTVSINSYNNTYNNGYNYGNNYYIANNPGSQYFSASISGNSVIVYGNNPGSATLNICSQYSGTSCASLYVVVSGNYYNGNNNYNGYNYNNYNGYNGGFSYTTPTYSYMYPSNYTYPSTSYTYPTNTYVSNANTGRSVSGVFLSQVPSTGISFGLKMTLFTLGLALWSLFAAYMIARRRDGAVVSGASLAAGSKNGTGSRIEAFKLSNMKKKGIL